eukprot:scaffold1424_cov168-Amphora_coffeaeformis.AAC.2
MENLKKSSGTGSATGGFKRNENPRPPSSFSRHRRRQKTAACKTRRQYAMDAEAERRQEWTRTVVLSFVDYSLLYSYLYLL